MDTPVAVAEMLLRIDEMYAPASVEPAPADTALTPTIS